MADTYTNTIKAGENLSTIAQKAGMTPAQFAALNPHLAGTGADSYQGLKNTVGVGTGYNLSAPAPVVPPPVVPPPAGGTPPPVVPPPGGGTPPPPETPADPTRYVRTANTNQDAIDRTVRDLSTANNIPAPDLATITQRNKDNAQALVDSITAEFNRQLDAQGVENNGLNDRVRALNTSSGLGGSDFATANAVGQERKNQNAIDLINADKAQKIAAVYSDVAARSQVDYQTERANYIAGLKDNLDQLRKAKDEDRAKALDSIKGFAAQGVSIDKLKAVDPATYGTLLKEYGGSQLDLETAWNANLPDNLKVQYGSLTKQGTNGNAVVIRYGLNPVTGKTENKEYDTGIKYIDFVGKGEPEIKEVDGRLWSVTRDDKGNQVAKPLTEVSDLNKSIINKNNADAAKSRADALGGGDSVVSQDLQDAKSAIDSGKDSLAVRQAFLRAHPTKENLYTAYFKEQY